MAVYIFFVFLGLVIYNLDGQPKEYKRVEPPLKYQHRCIAIFKDKKTPAQPTGKSPCKLGPQNVLLIILVTTYLLLFVKVHIF